MGSEHFPILESQAVAQTRLQGTEEVRMLQNKIAHAVGLDMDFSFEGLMFSCRSKAEGSSFPIAIANTV